MNSGHILDWLIWTSFAGDVVFLFAYTLIPPRDWYRHQMGWHLVAFSFALACVLGTTALRRVIGPIPLWGTYLELGGVGAVIWWRTIWAIALKFSRPRR